MIGCNVFRKKLSALLEGSISGDLKSALEQHMKSCEKCRRLYNEEYAADKALKDAAYAKDAGFRSSREQIINSIDKNRYGKSPVKRMYFNLRRNTFAYSACAALIILCMSSWPYLREIFNYIQRPQNIESTNLPQDNDAAYHSSLTTDSPAAFTKSAVSRESTPSGVIETELPLPGSIKDKNIDEILKKIDKQNPGAVPWSIGFAGNGKFAFYNYSALLAYETSQESSGFYSAVDLQKIDCGYMQGSVVTRFDFSPDGKSTAIWNFDMDGGLKNTANLYLCDLSSNKSKTISRENGSALVGAWSSNSSYYAFGYYNGGSIVIFDRANNASMPLKFDRGSIQKVFTSDEGDVLVISDKKYILRKNKNYTAEEISIPGEVLKFYSLDRIVYFDKGTIYQQNGNPAAKIKEIGENFKLVNNPDKSYAVFTDGVSTVVYNYLSDFYKYNFPYDTSGTVRFSPDLKKCYTVSGSTAKIITYTGKEIVLQENSDWAGMLESMWLNNDSLIRIAQKDSTKLGGFIIYKTDLVSTKGDSLAGQNSADVLGPSDIVKKYYEFTSQGKYIKAWDLLHPLAKTHPSQSIENLIRDKFLSMEGTKSPELVNVLDEQILDSYKMYSNQITYNDVAEVTVELSNGSTSKIHLLKDENNNWGLFWDPDTGLN